MPDMEKAARALAEACRDGQKIGICGDFDVDGLSGTAIIVETVRALGGRPVPYIPHREQDGHGVSMAAVRALCEAGVKLMVTVDTGSTDVAEIAAARAAGMATIITDHHLAGPESAGGWPDAVAIVNPHRAAREGPQPSGNLRAAPPLSGAGVALKLAQAACLVAQIPAPEDAMALAALGTIADSVPLRGDNRIIVRFGLEALGKTRHAGLRALLDHSRAQGAGGKPDTGLVSFQLAPRLNSAGRLGDAGPSLRLLTTADPGEAEALASRLDALNKERQRLSEVAWEEARGQLEVMDAGAPVIVVRCDSVPQGLLGPLAGRLCEIHRRPAIAIGALPKPQAGPADRAVRASARSTPEFDIHAAVAAQAGLLERFGGHARAAGFTVQEENLPAVLEGIRRQAAWTALAASASGGRPEIEADCDARLEELGVSLWDFVEAMAPFGEGNPAPLLISRRVQPLQVRTMGATGKHLRITLEDNGRAFDAVGFGLGGALLGSGTVDVAYGLRTSIWNGRVRLELDLKAVRPSVG
jgi:single-stranded-DNA-specific exonuclease